MISMHKIPVKSNKKKGAFRLLFQFILHIHEIDCNTEDRNQPYIRMLNINYEYNIVVLFIKNSSP